MLIFANKLKRGVKTLSNAMQEYERLYEGVVTPFGKLDLVAEFFEDYVKLTSVKYNCTVGYIENCTQFPDSLENIVIDYQDSILIDTMMLSSTLMEYTNLYKDGTIVKEIFEI